MVVFYIEKLPQRKRKSIYNNCGIITKIVHVSKSFDLKISEYAFFDNMKYIIQCYSYIQYIQFFVEPLRA